MLSEALPGPSTLMQGDMVKEENSAFYWAMPCPKFNLNCDHQVFKLRFFFFFSQGILFYASGISFTLYNEWFNFDKAHKTTM